MNQKFWKNKNVLITGHTGFKGGWLTVILNLLGAKVYGIALDPESKPNFFNLLKLKKYLERDIRGNIENYLFLNKKINQIRPNIIFHLAAQSKVRDSYVSSLNTIKTNIIGTSNILEIFKNNEYIKSLLITTTDKVYKNTNNKRYFKEEDQLGGDDIYSASKSASEILSNAYYKSFFIKSKKRSIVCLRSGNVIGGGDWTKDRIIPDCIKAIKNKKPILLRNPKSIRPWQHVLEPLTGYVITAEKMHISKKNLNLSINFGPKKSNYINVKKITKKLISNLKVKNKIIFKKTKDNFYEKAYLYLNNNKANKILKWKPILNCDQTISLTADWYQKYLKGKNLEKITIIQIKNYLNKYYAKKKI